jgi:drug/metabolite transporter (DMT)-like permease
MTTHQDDSMGEAARPEEPTKTSTRPVLDPVGLLNLAVVYVVWSSTYLAIRVAVREGAGFPPFTLGLLRMLVAGILLLIWGKFRGARLIPTRKEFLVLMGSGLLLWPIANGLVNWAEQHADSGIAALTVASAPIWTALIESILDRRTPSLRLILALFTGFAGIALLSMPSLLAGATADTFAILALLFASFCWSGGSVLQSRRQVSLSPRVSSGYQHLIGGAGFMLIVFLLQEPKPSPTPSAWLAWGFLVVFGSFIAFTAFVISLQRLPIRVTMTYAYVNPVGAMLLGALVLKEPITLWTLGGAVLVLLGVVGVFRDRFHEHAQSTSQSSMNQVNEQMNGS